MRSDDRSLTCWGSNTVGQLGNGLVELSAGQVVVADAGPWDAVAAGSLTTCAIKSDKTLFCWGRRLGTSASKDVTPTQIAGDTWQKIALGTSHACGITETGNLRCLGGNFNGQLGDGTITSRTTPVAALVDGEDLAGWTDVAVNGNHSCGLNAGRWLCWGSSATGQLGRDGTAVNQTAVEIGAGTVWSRLASGFGHNCAIAADQRMFCIGRRGFGELGNGSTSPRLPVEIGGDWESINAGSKYLCGVANEDDSVQCVGANEFGQLGNGGFDAQNRLAKIAGSSPFVSISAGSFHTCGLRSDNMATCWGANYFGQSTGVPGTSVVSAMPVHTASAVSANGEHTCVIDGTQVVCWGANQFGQLGNNMMQTFAPPGPISSPASFVAVEAGEAHTCAIDAMSSVSCWGAGLDGRLGAGTDETPKLAPVAVTTSGDVSQLIAGDDSTCAANAAGITECWGSNYSGELGVGDRAPRPTPIAVGPWDSLALGAVHGCGIRTTELFCWGLNDQGQLGIDSLVETLQPTRVQPATTWTEVAVGDGFTCALDGDRSMWCWGDNGFGQIGDGNSWTLEPVQVIAQ